LISQALLFTLLRRIVSGLQIVKESVRFGGVGDPFASMVRSGPEAT